jgi:cytochrome c2
MFSLGACVRTAPPLSEGGQCVGCHKPHHLEVRSCAPCHGGDAGAQRRELAHYRLIYGKAAEHGVENSMAVADGRKLVESLACRRCHTIGEAGNRLATSLDHVVWKREQHALARSIGEPVENMPRFGMSRFEVEKVIAFLLHGARPELAEATYRVRFERRRGMANLRFEERCGGCHRALLADGPAGRGSAGPNLSGLFTRYYPTAFVNRPWTPASLRDWLRNPRALRPQTTMRPVRLEDPEWPRLLEEFGVTAAR